MRDSKGDLRIKSVIDEASLRLKKADITTADFEARIFAGSALGKLDPGMYADDGPRATEEDYQKVMDLVEKRLAGYPMQYVLKNTCFFDCDLYVDESVFIPRPETELLVQCFIDAYKDHAGELFVLDLCTGSGNIAIALTKHLSQCKILASDISREALLIAQKNAEMNGSSSGITFMRSDLFGSLKKGKHKFDAIVSNPPYIKTAQIDALQTEIAFEPRIALDGGGDGLAFYKKILAQAPEYLKENGRLFIEIGYDQKDDLAELLNAAGCFKNIKALKDYSGYYRVITAARK
jgi:release factor glutamine methyltransferase